MRRFLASFVAVAVVGAISFAFAGDDKHKGHDHKAGGPKAGEAAPLFHGTDQNGKAIDLAALKGKIVVLEWFNEECPFVVKHYANGDMNTTAANYAGKDVVWVAINSTSGKTAADMTKVATDWKMDRSIVVDADGEIGRDYGSKNTPTMYIIDKEGKVAYRGAIDSNSSSKASDVAGATNYVAKALDEMLAGKSVSTPETKAYGCSVKYGK